jgi:L-alanine-DL-glutamate epimerase-like enolase superfamily enzyme
VGGPGTRRPDAAVERLAVEAYTIPTDRPESDGTATWDSTTIVVVEAIGGGRHGVGYTYGPAAIGMLIQEQLAGVVAGRDVMAVREAWLAMAASLRNAGRPGIGAMAMSAVDLALWDLKARALGAPLAGLLGAAHHEIPIYGSGGFTSYAPGEVADQLGGWVSEGIPRVKMKIGRDGSDDVRRIDAARRAVGDAAELMVDANGAYGRAEALRWADRLAAEWSVNWFEEPVPSSDPEGLRAVHDRRPPGLEIAAGEYGYVIADFRTLLESGGIDCLQADVTRCGGITGLLQVGGLALGHGVDVSGHCAPAASVHALCALESARHLEWFHDHVRIESMLFEGVPRPRNGALVPDMARPGNGLELRRADADRFAA